MLSDKKELSGITLIILFGVLSPILFPNYRIQLSELWIFMVFASTWNIQGGKMGYNSFGNIIFFGLGMYLCASTQIAYAFDLAEWTAAGGVKTFVHTASQYFIGLPLGLIIAGLVPALIAGFFRFINFRIKRSLLCYLYIRNWNCSWRIRNKRKYLGWWSRNDSTCLA